MTELRAIVCYSPRLHAETCSGGEGHPHRDCYCDAYWNDGRPKSPCAECESDVATTLRRVAKPSMEVNISFRISRSLRDAAREKAEERQENVSDVLRKALERYVRSKR